MKKSKTILLILVLATFVTLSGCSTSTDSLIDARIRILPNTRAFAGKNASEVEVKATAATTARAAMKSEVATTPTGVAEIMNAFNSHQ